MASLVDEQQQWFDEATNTPIVNGFIYVGSRNSDPRVAKAIFSDRELTTPLANPQRTDSAGRSVDKIWTEGRFSIEVSNSDDVQKYIEIDNGEGAGAGVIALGDVQGANNITATASTTITSYEDLQQFVFRSAQINTGAVTLNIDSVGTKSIVKNNGKPIQAGNFKAIQNVIVTYNLTNDNFEWVDQNLISVASYKGANIADSATPTVPTDGDFFEYAGATATTAFTVAANRQFTVKMTTGRTLTASASIVTIDGGDLILAAGAVVTLQSTSSNIVQVIAPLGVAATKSQQEATTNNTVFVTPLNQQFHPSAIIASGIVDGTGTVALTGAYNVQNLTDLGTGRYRVEFINDAANADYKVATSPVSTRFIGVVNKAVGQLEFNTFNTGASFSDADFEFIVTGVLA